MVFRIFKMIATSGFLTALECIIFVFGRGSASDPTGGVYSTSQDPLAGFRGHTSKGEEREEEGKERKRGEEGDGRDCPPFANSLICPC